MQSLLGFLPLADYVIDRRRTILVGERDVEVYKKIQQELSTGGTSKRKTTERQAEESVKKEDGTLRHPRSKDLIGIGGRGERSLTHEDISAKAESLDESSRDVVPKETEENLALLKKATVFAKDGYVVHPNNGAAMTSVWVPRGWRCDEIQPSWNTTVLQFKPSQDALEMAARVGTEATPINRQKNKKQRAKTGKGSFDRSEESCTNSRTMDPSVPDDIASHNSFEGSASGSSVFRLFAPETFISPVAAADPVACLRLTIQDLHAEVGEQTAAEYVADVVSAIYRDQTRFVASKYKVNGPKILIDQPLQGKAKGTHHGGGDNPGGGSDTGGATTTTDDEDFSFSRYQRMFSSTSSKSAKNPPILLSGSSCASAAEAAISPASAFSSGSMTKYVPQRIGGFSHILSYTTSTIIGQRTDKPRRVQVCSTSVVAVKDRFVYSLELQSSPPNHAISCRAAPSSSSKEEFDDPSLASSSWMAAFLQVAQVMSFHEDTENDQSKESSASYTGNYGGGGHESEDESNTRDTHNTKSQQRPPQARANISSSTRHGAPSSRDTSSSLATSKLPKGTHFLRSPLISEPHCSIEVFLEEEEAEMGNTCTSKGGSHHDGSSSLSSSAKRCAALYFTCETPPLWTPSLMNPNPLTSSSPNRAVFRPMECSSTDAAAGLCVGTEQVGSGLPNSCVTRSTGTVVVPLVAFETNSEAFPARVEVYVSRFRTVVITSQFETGRENQEAQLSKTAFAETIAALDLQRSYTTPAQTLQLPRHSHVGMEDYQQRWRSGFSNPKETTPPCCGGDVVTITPCQETVRPNPFALAMGVKPSASLGALSGRRVAMRPLATTRLHAPVPVAEDGSTATPSFIIVERFSIIAVEVPLRRNVMKCPTADLARVVGSVAFPSVLASLTSNNKTSCSSASQRREEKSLSALLDAIASQALSNQNTVLLQEEEGQWRRGRFEAPHLLLNLTLDRRLVIPSLGIALSVGDGCQCLASSLRPEMASVAIRPCQPYADSNELEDHSKIVDDNTVCSNASPLLFFVRKRNAKDTGLVTAVDRQRTKADAANTTNAEIAAVEDEGLITIETNFDADPKPEPLSSLGIRARAVLQSEPTSKNEEGSELASTFRPKHRKQQAIPAKGKDMTVALASSVAELACELAEEEEGLSLSTDEVVITDWLAMVGGQRQGVIRHEWRGGSGSTSNKAGELKMIMAEEPSHGEGGSILPRLFSRVCSGGPDAGKSSFLTGGVVSPVPESTIVSVQSSVVVKKEYAALQAHLRSATDAANGVFVSLESVCDVVTARGAVIKAVSPTFSLYKKHRALIMDLIFPSVEFY